MRNIFFTGLLVSLGASWAQAEMATLRLGAPSAAERISAKQEAGVPKAYVVEIKKSPKLDGDLSDEAWAEAMPLSLVRTLDGTDDAAKPTYVRLCRDDTTLYIAVRALEPLMTKIRAPDRARDGPVYNDDSIEIYLGKEESYLHFIVNAAGFLYDGRDKNGSWNSTAHTATGRGQGEWTLELAIPLKEIGCDAAALKTEWIANFNRNRFATGELQESSWSPTGIGDSHQPNCFGRLIFGLPPDSEKNRGVSAEKSNREILSAKGGDVVRFDLSALPKNARIFRADLLVSRTNTVDGQNDEALTDIEVYPIFTPFATDAEPKPGGDPLAIRGPWFDQLDATEAVKQWAGGKSNGGFCVKALPFWKPEATCLDIWYEGKTKSVPAQASGLKVFHRGGQTFIVWKEIEDRVGKDHVVWRELKTLLSKQDQVREVRYCIFRSPKPITAATLNEAELVARVAPLSGWNVNGRSVEKAIDHALASQYALIHGNWNPFSRSYPDGEYGLDCPIDRLVIRENEGPLTRDTGLYVHCATSPSKVYYAVVTSDDGVLNTQIFSGENALSEAVEETPASSIPVLQSELPQSPFWSFRERRWHYVQFVGPPLVNLPYQYYNWSVGEPLKHADQMPLEMSLPRGGGRSYFRTQYRIDRDSLVLTPHDAPFFTGWYGYHENLGTLKSFKRGMVCNYTERRLLAFMDWACQKWPVDRNRITVTAVVRTVGGSGVDQSGDDGASVSGALHLGLRHPNVFNTVQVGGGIADYGGAIKADLIKDSLVLKMEALWGKPAWEMKTETGENVYDELNLVKLVKDLSTHAELPLLTIVLGRGNEARELVDVLLAKGHACFTSGNEKLLALSANSTWQAHIIRQDVRKNMSLPVFRSTKRGYRWSTTDIVDEPDQYAVSLFGPDGVQDTLKEVDVTLRRLQRFKVVAGKTYAWTLNALQSESDALQKGTVLVGLEGGLAIPKLKLAASGGRLKILPE